VSPLPTSWGSMIFHCFGHWKRHLLGMFWVFIKLAPTWVLSWQAHCAAFVLECGDDPLQAGQLLSGPEPSIRRVWVSSLLARSACAVL